MANNLNFLELFRLARVQEARVSSVANDPLLNKLIKYIDKIQDGSFTQEDFDLCIDNRLEDIFRFIKFDSELYNKENMIKALKLNGLLLGYIPDSKQTRKICEIALANNGLALGYVSKDILDDGLVRIALRQNPESKELLARIYNDVNSPSEDGGGDYTIDYISSLRQIVLKKNGVVVSTIDASIFLVSSSIKSIKSVKNPEGKPEGTYIEFVYVIEDGTEQKAYINITEIIIEEITNKLNGKVDKVEGKGLSTNDFTNEDKAKLDGLSNYDDTEVRNLITQNSNAIENKVSKENGKSLISDSLISKINSLTNKVSQFENDAKYITENGVKQIVYTKEEVNAIIDKIRKLNIPSIFSLNGKDYELTIDDTKDEFILTKVITKHLINENVSFTLNQTTFHYNGEVITPEIEVRYDGELLEEGKDYNVRYLNDEDNVTTPREKGEYFVEIIGKGWYDQSRRESFSIID